MMNIRFHTEITFSCQSLQHQDNKQLWVFNFFCGLTPTFANIGGVMLKGRITLLQ